MAFRKDKTTAAQTAFNAGAAVAAGLASSGSITTGAEALEVIKTIAEGLFGESTTLAQVVDGDNALFEATEAAAPAKKSYAPKGGGSTNSGPKVTLEDARATVFNFGKFKGVSLGDVYDMPASKAQEFGHGEGDKAGKTYVQWLAKTTDEKTGFMRRRAQVILDAARESSDADAA